MTTFVSSMFVKSNAEKTSSFFGKITLSLYSTLKKEASSLKYSFSNSFFKKSSQFVCTIKLLIDYIDYTKYCTTRPILLELVLLLSFLQTNVTRLQTYRLVNKNPILTL